MPTAQHWIENYFDEASDAIYLFQDDTLLVSNKLAKDLQEELHFAPNYLVQVADAAVKQKFAPTDDCFSCSIRNLMHEISIPITLANDKRHPLNYFLIYHVIDVPTKVFSLTLKSRGTIDRMDQMAEQRELSRYVSEAQEKERKSISEDLHDSIAQSMYSAIMGVRRLAKDHLSQTEAEALTTGIEKQLNDTLAEVKGMALDIRPSVLDNFGLIPALRVLAERSEEATGITISVSGSAKTDVLSPETQNVLYRIAQEAIHNALKHAEPHEIDLLLVSHNHFITLEVMDDGKGFTVPEHQEFNGRSMGLMNMNERVKALNGAFSIKSEPGNGTMVTVKFPVALD